MSTTITTHQLSLKPATYHHLPSHNHNRTTITNPSFSPLSLYTNNNDQPPSQISISTPTNLLLGFDFKDRYEDVRDEDDFWV